LGVVPHQDIEYFTFGRSGEIQTIEKGLKELKNGSGGVYLIEGEYGSGKTHLLEYARHLSLKSGLVTAYCELHIPETPPYRPKKVYHELVYNLRYIRNGYEYCYRDLLREATKIDITDHCFLTPVLKKVKETDNHDLHSEVFWQWIEGESTKDYATCRLSPYRVRGGQSIPALYDFSTAADFYNFILSGLSYLTNKIGLGGIVIILDEFETLQHIWGYTSYVRGSSFLEGIIRTALNDKSLKIIDNRMLHNRVRPTPYCYKEPHILLIIATTPIQHYQTIENLSQYIENKIYLRKFSRGELEFIFDNLLQVYKCAYKDFDTTPESRTNIFTAAFKKNRENLREFIKFSVEAMDWLRLSR
jgi:hypothetical protein